MRKVRIVRNLTPRERRIAMPVFRSRLPYDRILVSDGLGGGDRPFTVPTNLPLSPLFNVDSKIGKYVLHVGDGVYGMHRTDCDRNLLIHELTHVWQGEHWPGHSWKYVLNSLYHQARKGSDAYWYDDIRFEDWDKYNAEQQAEIVEDWYKRGMKQNHREDRRFYYIKKYIWGEDAPRSWLLEVYPLDEGRIRAPLARADDLDSYLIPLLEKRYHKDDEAGYRARVQELERIFGQLNPDAARSLLARLERRQSGDRVAGYFHGHLATGAKVRLRRILRER